MEEQLSPRKRARDDSSESDSPDTAEAKRIREDLLVLLDDADMTPSGGCVGGDGESDSRELDSIMKSFEEELSGSGSCGGNNLTAVCSTPVVNLASDPGESLPDLGFLLGASDDELGLPCSTPPPPQPRENSAQDPVCSRANELARVSSESYGIGELWLFDDGIPSYDDSFGFGIGGSSDAGDDNGDSDFVALDGIFHYSDVNFGPSDYAENTWRSRRLCLPCDIFFNHPSLVKMNYL